MAACIFKRNKKKVESVTEQFKPDEPVDEESIADMTTTKKLRERHSRFPILVEELRDEKDQERSNVYEEDSR